MTADQPTTVHSGPDLVAASVEVLSRGQHASGGYVACPTYPTYGYAWLRDGAFCAYAMELAGRPDSAARFHEFVAGTLLAHRDRVTTATMAAATGTDRHLLLPTRYTLDGRIEPAAEAWPNFQIDGYGAWLWTLRDHLDRTGTPDGRLLQAADLASDYLLATSHLPCYDCWEEYAERRHTSTLACVIAGLEAVAEPLSRPDLASHAAQLRDQLDARHLRAGGYVKHDATDGVDGSLLWLAIPFGVVAPTDPRMTSTAQRIAAELTGPTGGVRRYLGDEFYGGGEWILLTAWLGWYHAITGDLTSAAACRRWIEATATSDGHLPEQVTAAPQHPDRVQPWEQRWGPVATPLLWSHAMYLVLDHALTAASAQAAEPRSASEKVGASVGYRLATTP